MSVDQHIRTRTFICEAKLPLPLPLPLLVPLPLSTFICETYRTNCPEKTSATLANMPKSG